MEIAELPFRDGSFTKGELAFMDAYVEHQDRAKAEKLAGIAPRAGYAMLSRPDVQAEIARRMTADLHDMAALAVGTLRKLMESEKIPAQVRFNAAKYTLDKVLGESGAGPAKDVHEMSPEELAQGIAKLEGIAAALAKPVTDSAIFD